MAKWKKVDFKDVSALEAGTYLRIRDIDDSGIWTEVEGVIKGEWFMYQNTPTNYLVMEMSNVDVDFRFHLVPSFENVARYEIRVFDGVTFV